MIKEMFLAIFYYNCRKNVHVGRFYETIVKFRAAGDVIMALTTLIGVFGP